MLPLDSRVGPDCWVHNKVVKHLHPRVVLRQVVVVFRRDFLDQRQPRSGDVREVVMLVVVSDVPRYCIQRPIVAVRFKTLCVHVMLGDKVACDKTVESADCNELDVL